jgi:hypothetical protein
MGGFSIAAISFLARIEELICLNILARRCSENRPDARYARSRHDLYLTIVRGNDPTASTYEMLA